MGKLVIKLIRSGGRLVSGAIQAARERSYSKDSEYTPPQPTSNTIPPDHIEPYILANEEIARDLIHEGHAELPASNEISIHQQCAELPAANEPSIHRDYVELPSVSNEYHQICYKGTQYPVNEKANHKTIQPSRSPGYPESSHSADMQNERLPTYEESEWAPVAFSGAEETTASQRRSIHRAPPGLDDDLRGIHRPTLIPRCRCGNNA